MKLPTAFRKRSGDEPPADPPDPVSEGSAEAEVVADGPAREKHPSWSFDEGAPIASGRTVLKKIGGGNRYEVYLVWDDFLFAIGVAKVLRPDQVERDKALKDLGEEAEVLGRLAHPGIVRIFDAVLEGPHPHVLIEHLEGPSLRRLIRRGRALTLQQLLPLALHIAATLHYMSRMGVVHLDVKPDNIIMGVPPRLIDLSIARSLDRAVRTRGPIGTDAYMAPEQCGVDAVDVAMGPASDVWGLGATLYHAVSGRRPFPRPEGARDSDDPSVRFPQLHEEPRRLSGREPPELRELILAMLRRDPAERPSAEAVAQRLEPLVAAQPSKLRLSRRGVPLG